MTTTVFDKNRPFLASMTERVYLTKPDSLKKTQHLVLDLKGSGLSYQPGDSIGVYPRHDPELVSKTLKALKACGSEKVFLKSSDEPMTLEKCFTSSANITSVSPKLLRAVAERQTNPSKKEQLQTLQTEENRAAFKAFVGMHEVWDFLKAHEEVQFTPQELVDLLMPLLPRFYSIASSQKFVGDEVHLTVAPFEYESNGQLRRGVCTHFLCSLASLHTPEVPLFVQSSHGFSLPNNSHVPLIMIGPGTGVAPFRSFLQERLHSHKSTGRHWLFFGERNRAHDFLYEEDWKQLCKNGHLRLDLAFSRDQKHKLYVQHKMWEHGDELYRWLEEGAYIYVCGDASRMAKDVEAMLLAIIQEFGKKEVQESKEYIKRLRREKRYLRDIY
jgi:sulfite reductase (NADPH) flavoprotein alpha-component